jgi:PEP-CTERM motif
MMKHSKKALALALFASAGVAGNAQAAQIALTPGNVIGSSGDYGSEFLSGNILNQQTGAIDEVYGDFSYWLNPSNGIANAYITVDLGQAYQIGSFELFNSHNGHFNDRGTGNFSIVAGNALSGNVITGAVTLVAGALLAESDANDPLNAQVFNVANTGSFRYLQFLPTSVAVFGGGQGCCQPNNYGLNELRVFDAPPTGGVPEPASWAMMITGFGLVGGAMRRRKVSVTYA